MKSKPMEKEKDYTVEDKNPPVDTKKLNEIVGRATGQGYGAARKGPTVV
jgi:hypothetical protein|tara:strand:- start:276 stop:422 length:147 start_codon:yes stop_codon:yes gene_type:complete